MSEDCFVTATAGHVTTITFNSPPSNFVTPGILSRSADLLERLDQDSTCRAVLLRAGGKIFCAGADLSDAAENGPEGTEATARAASSPSEALEMGLVDQLSTIERLDADALAFATEIAANAPLAVQSTRATLRRELAEQIRAQTDREGIEQQKLFRTHDFAEGVKAMAGRRPPSFEGR